MQTATPTLTPCPSWCWLDHTGADDDKNFHASSATDALGTPIRLWQADVEGSRPGIMLAGELLTEGQAHELGLALVRMADRLRREESAR